MLEHVVEVVALHDHVVEFQEGEPLLHTLLVALGAQHVIDTEAGANFAQQLYIVQVQEPVGVIQHHSLAIAEFDKTLHLTFEAFCIVRNVFLCEHFAHIRTAGRIADHGGATANQGDGTVTSHLQTLHQGQSHKMARGQTVRGAVKANVEGCFTIVDDFFDFFLVGHLRDQTARFQFIVDRHKSSS